MLGSTDNPQVPVQLIQILTKINENISDVKERVIRIEAQDHQFAIRTLRADLEEEAKQRRALEDKVNAFTNKMAPILAGGTALVTLVLNYLVRVMHL
jgi:hypothetical protein